MTRARFDEARFRKVLSDRHGADGGAPGRLALGVTILELFDSLGHDFRDGCIGVAERVPGGVCQRR